MAVIWVTTLEIGPRIPAAQRLTTFLRQKQLQAPEGPVTGSRPSWAGFTELQPILWSQPQLLTEWTKALLLQEGIKFPGPDFFFFLLLSTVCVIKRSQIAASNLCIYKWPHWSARKKGGDRLSCLSFSTELWLVIFLMKVWDCFLSTLGGYKGIALFLWDFQQQEYESFKQNESAECTGVVRHPKGFPVPWMIPSKARIEDQMHLFHFGQCYFSAWERCPTSHKTRQPAQGNSSENNNSKQFSSLFTKDFVSSFACSWNCG